MKQPTRPQTFRHLLIVGTRGQGRVVLDCIEDKYEKITFMADGPNAQKVGDYPTLLDPAIPLEYIKDNFTEVIIAIGDNKTRMDLSLKYISYGIKLAVIIHPSAVVSKYAEIEAGTVILENAVISSGAKIGKACIINTGAIVGHDCILEDGVHISPNTAMGGTVKIGKKTWVCLGCSISNKLTIGENVVIGAGAVVLKNVQSNVLVAGIPAIVKKYLKA